MAQPARSGVRFTALVCAYSDERWDDLCAVIRSLEGQTLPPEQIVAVIDHNPGLLERVRQQFPRVTVTANASNRGLSGSRNTGIKLATGDVIAFVDDDAVAEPDWLERLAAVFTSENILGAGGSVIPRWDGGRPRWFPDEFDWVVGCTYRGMPDKTAPIRNLIGCNMALRRTVFDEVGGFQEQLGRIGKLPLGCEETELCIRARQRWPGGEMVFDPSAAVHHRVRLERATWHYFRQRCYSEGISKLQISREIGSKDGLSSERTYATRTLPLGALRNLAEVVVRLDIAGLARAFAIVAGLTITAVGYGSAALSRRVAASGSERS